MFLKSLKWVSLLFAGFSMVACTVMQTVPPTKSQSNYGVQVGDRVEVRNADGTSKTFTVNFVDEIGVNGEGGEKAKYEQITQIHRKKTDWWKTGLIGAAVAGVLLLFVGGDNSVVNGGW